MRSSFQRSCTSGRSRLALVAGIAALLTVSVAAPGATAAPANGSAASSGADLAAPAAKAKKRCRTVRVKKRTKSGALVKRNGKVVYVKRKKCRPKAKPKSTPTPIPLPAPAPAPAPVPAPTPASPKIDQLLGWSTLAQDPETPPAGLVATAGTVSSCPNPDGLSIYIRRSGFTSIGLVSHVWTRDGVVIASGTNSSTVDGAFRYGIVGSPLVNGLYEVTWSFGGAAIGSASVTRSCP